MFQAQGNIKEYNTEGILPHSGIKNLFFSKLAVIVWEMANEHKVRNLENSKYLDPDSTRTMR